MRKIVVYAIVIATFAGTGGWPALASLAPAFPSPAVQVELAEADSASADRDSYAQKARAEVQEWRDEIDRFGERAKVRSAQAWKTASEDLNATWIKTREASDKLQKAGEAGWSSARDSYRKAVDELAAKWTKVRADEK
jgi:uncharacterized membrane protein